MSVVIRNITKHFGNFQALENIDLEIPDGRLAALLGPSGSGKTTLLRILAGLEHAEPKADSEILFHGRPVLGLPAGKRKVGMVFQHYALFRHMTIFENVAFGLRVQKVRGKAAIRQRVEELLELVQLGDLARRYPAQLSGGQRQRVALARALAVQPDVLLLDEPFGALDAQVRGSLRRWLREFQERLGITAIFVTHDQEEALELADQIVVMNQGRIEQVGTPHELLHTPASEFVMRFFGRVNEVPLRVGGPGKAFVRPHELELLPAGATADVEAEVVRSFEIGATWRVILKSCADGLPLEAEFPAGETAAERLARGSRLGLRVRQAVEIAG